MDVDRCCCVGTGGGQGEAFKYHMASDLDEGAQMSLGQKKRASTISKAQMHRSTVPILVPRSVIGSDFVHPPPLESLYFHMHEIWWYSMAFVLLYVPSSHYYFTHKALKFCPPYCRCISEGVERELRGSLFRPVHLVVRFFFHHK